MMTTDNQDLRQEVEGRLRALTGRLIETRREFHRCPETAFKETRTSQLIRDKLQSLSIPHETVAGTGIIGRIDGKGAGPTIALRADIDALPLEEENEVEYRSEHPGTMHACGHDGHIAMLLAVAEVLAAIKDKLTGSIVLLFQPSEEMPPGGAPKLIEEGALEGIDYIFGTHLWSPLPVGKVAVFHGTAMAASDSFYIDITGKGGHGSMPHETIDPLTTACQLVTALQTVVSRNVEPQQPAVVSVGTLHAGTEFNIIPDKVSLSGTVRCFDPGVRSLMKARIERITEGICQAAEAGHSLRYVSGYPSVINDSAATDVIQGIAEELLGADNVLEHKPVMGGEDFAYYLQRVRGSFFFTGAGNPAKGIDFPHHHPRFNIDEDALIIGARIMVMAALKFLR